MPPIGPDQDDDQDTRSGAEDPDEEALRQELIEMLKGADTLPGDGEEADGLLAPMDDVSLVKTTVSVEDGMERAERARAGGKTVADAQGDIDNLIADKPTDDKPTDSPADTAAAPPTAAQTSAPDADIAQLLEGIDDTKRVAIQTRIEAGQDVLKHFAGREQELALHGVTTPGQAIERLLHLNEFVQSKPDEYLAWVATEMNKTAPQDILSAAAKHLGYKLVPDVEEGADDEFDDDEKKELKAKLKALQGAKEPFGPDAPKNVAAMQIARSLREFTNAKDGSGQPMHPLADKFTPEISAKVRDWRASNGNKIPSAAELSRFYFEVAPGGAPAPAPTQPAAAPTQPAQPAQSFAAQPAASVPEKAKTAAQPDRSAAASKLLDGSGPGADRRPASSSLTGDALLRSQIAESMAAAREK